MEDGRSEVQLGQTRVMAYVTSRLVQPHRDRPNEGTLSIFTEFSPMADPSFEIGRPGELAIELGRIIDRGLRESWAVDWESLCIVGGRFVWAIRVDLHILDNGGNLIDAANTAALVALFTFRQPECTIGGEDGQEVTLYPPEVREPLPLIIHHLPIAVTFAIFHEGNNLVIDPTYREEAVMGGRITVTINSNGDVCAIQKAGGAGVMPSVIMQCLRIASLKAAEFTSKIKETVDAYNEGRLLRQVKRHKASSAVEVPEIKMEKSEVDELRYHMERLKSGLDKSCSSKGYGVGVCTSSSKLRISNAGSQSVDSFVGARLNWDPYPQGISSDFLRRCMALPGSPTINRDQERIDNVQEFKKFNPKKSAVDIDIDSSPVEVSILRQQKSVPKSLKDAVKPKDRRKK
uniref:Protein ECERIFERUM 7 n=1 Tax=Anthurium amnicola TaxID=1678845 RepID=A0A1D1YK24_9ARAE